MVLTNSSITTWHIYEKRNPRLSLKLCQEVVDTSVPQWPKIILMKCAHQLTVVDLLDRNLRLFTLSVTRTRLFSGKLKAI